MQESFELLLGRVIDAAPQILAAVLTFIFLIILGRLASNGVGKLLGEDRSKAIKQTRLIKRLIRWAFNVLGLVIALNLVGLTQVASSFLAAGGVVAVVLGFAFREIGENLLAGLFLSISRSFDVGDLIESNGIRGVVKRIEIRDVHIRTVDGCDIFIPSATIYKNSLHNFTRDGLRRGNFTVGIDYGDELQKAREVLLEAVQENEFSLDEPTANIQVSGFTPTYVELEVFFWINTFKEGPELSEVRSQIMNACQKTLAKHGFTFSSNVTTAVDMLPVNVKVSSE
jgi:small-conductance mechanosensitive channel